MGSNMGVIGEILSGKGLDPRFRVLNVESFEKVFKEGMKVLNNREFGILMVKIDVVGDGSLEEVILRNAVRNLKSSVRLPHDMIAWLEEGYFLVFLSRVSFHQLRNIAARLIVPLSISVGIGDKTAKSMVSIACLHGSEITHTDLGVIIRTLVEKLTRGNQDKGFGIHCD